MSYLTIFTRELIIGREQRSKKRATKLDIPMKKKRLERRCSADAGRQVCYWIIGGSSQRSVKRNGALKGSFWLIKPRIKRWSPRLLRPSSSRHRIARIVREDLSRRRSLRGNESIGQIRFREFVARIREESNLEVTRSKGNGLWEWIEYAKW